MAGKNIFRRTVPLIAAVILTGLSSCGKNMASVEGHITGADKASVALEMVSAGNTVWSDTTVTDAGGAFRFAPELPSGRTTLYNLKVNGAVIPLFVSPGEKVVIKSHYDTPGSYSVEGSRESELLKEITDIMSSGARTLDSLYKISLTAEDETLRGKITEEYTEEYRSVKREHIKFIMANHATLAAVYALRQRLPGDEFLSDGSNDIVYYRDVAEHTSEAYPGSPYVAALKKEIANYDAAMALAGEVADMAENPASFPEIEMPDRYGRLQKLSDRTGKVIILDFWSSEFPEAAVMNAEYKELYEKFANSGLEIFQVSIDDSRTEWVTAVQEQQIPWTTVFDTKRSGSTAARIYNVSEIPANYLIGADGTIIRRNVFGERLRTEITKALGKIE